MESKSGIIQTLPSETFLIQASKALQTSLLKCSADFSPPTNFAAQPGPFKSWCIPEKSGYSLSHCQILCCQGTARQLFFPVPKTKPFTSVPHPRVVVESLKHKTVK